MALPARRDVKPPFLVEPAQKRVPVGRGGAEPGPRLLGRERSDGESLTRPLERALDELRVALAFPVVGIGFDLLGAVADQESVGVRPEVDPRGRVVDHRRPDPVARSSIVVRSPPSFGLDGGGGSERISSSRSSLSSGLNGGQRLHPVGLHRDPVAGRLEQPFRVCAGRHDDGVERPALAVRHDRPLASVTERDGRSRPHRRALAFGLPGQQPGVALRIGPTRVTSDGGDLDVGGSKRGREFGELLRIEELHVDPVASHPGDLCLDRLAPRSVALAGEPDVRRPAEAKPLLAGELAEALDRPPADPGVDVLGERVVQHAGRPAAAPAPDLAALEQRDAHAATRKVVRRRGTHRPAADHGHVARCHR